MKDIRELSMPPTLQFAYKEACHLRSAEVDEKVETMAFSPTSSPFEIRSEGCKTGLSEE